MAKYSMKAQRAASTTLAVGTLACPGSGMRRIKIYDMVVGSEATPADNAFLWQVQRSTTASTSTAVTPQSLDPADAAAVSVGGENTTVNGTTTANAFLATIALNQRATFRWVCAPGGELTIPASANNGVHIMTPTSSAVNVSAQVYFEEQ